MRGFGALSNALFVTAGVLSLIDHVSAPPTSSRSAGEPVRHPGSPKTFQQQAKEYVATMKKQQGKQTSYDVKKYHAKDQRERIDILVEVINDFKLDPFIYQSATHIARRLGGRERYNQAKYIHHLVRENVEYVNDVVGVDVYQSAPFTFALGRGDCDDMNIAVCTMALSMGLPCRLKTVRTLVKTEDGKRWEKNPDWNHIYTMIGVRNTLGGMAWYASDPTGKKFEFGMEAHPSLVIESEEYDAVSGELVRRWINPKLRG